MRIHRVHPANTIEDLRDTVRRFGPDIIASGVPLHVTVDGYDNDMRELGDIPEVRKLCERIVESGLLSLLHPNLGDERNHMLWGAIDVWAASKGLIKNYQLDIEQQVFDEFWTDLLRSNAVANALVGSPRDPKGSLAGIAGTTHGASTADGAHDSVRDELLDADTNPKPTDGAFLFDLYQRHQRGDEFDTCRATKDALAAEGARWWPVCFRGDRTDDEAFERAMEAYLPLISETAPLDARVLMRQIAAARWCDQGFPVVQMAHTYASALMATQVASDLATEVRPPWKAFVIQLPNHILPVHLGGEPSHANFILVRLSETKKEGVTWSFWVFHDRGYLAFDDLAPSELLAEEMTFDMDECPEAVGGATEIDADIANRIRLIAARLILNACCAMTNDPANLKPLRRAPPKRTIGRHHPEPPQYRCFELGEPVQVDCREAIREFLTPGSKRTGKAPSVMTLVCGHRKQQAFGPRHTLRKTIWVQPYWRGPDGAPIVMRPHVLGDSLAKTTPADVTPSTTTNSKKDVAS